jgi:hypothetical protein
VIKITASIVVLGFLVAVGVTNLSPARADQTPNACVNSALKGQYPRLGAPVHGRLTRADMLKVSRYEELEYSATMRCSSLVSTVSGRRIDQAAAYQHLMRSGALLLDAGQKSSGDATMDKALAALQKLVAEASVAERPRLETFLGQAQQIYSNPGGAAIADAP